MTPDNGPSNVSEGDARYTFEVTLQPRQILLLDNKVALRFHRRRFMAIAPDGIDLSIGAEGRMKHLTFSDHMDGYTIAGFRFPTIDPMPRVVAPPYDVEIKEQDGSLHLTVGSDHKVATGFAFGSSASEVGKALVKWKRRMDQADREEPFS